VVLEDFIRELKSQNTHDDLIDFCRKHVLHGIPFVFSGRENEYYDFKKEISKKFQISFHEVFITGSGKLGFSPFKQKIFDYDSDIDIALISPNLFENVMNDVGKYQMNFRKARAVVSQKELDMYHKFLEYVALGWIRPDKLPISFQMKTMKDDWFSFFDSISYGKSQVGNYKVNAGIFKSYRHLEEYIVSGLSDIHNLKLVEIK
jgi:hypothetical protein